MDRLTFSPWQLGEKITHLFENNPGKLEYEVFIKNPDGSAVNNESIKFYSATAEDMRSMVHVTGGDSKGKRIKLDAEHVINPDLKYILWKIYNNEVQKNGATYTITADPELDMKHAIPADIKKALKPDYQLEIGHLKIDSGKVVRAAHTRAENHVMV